MKVFDCFGMIPPPMRRDGGDVQARYQEIVSGKSVGIGGDAYYGYRNNLKGKFAITWPRLAFRPPITTLSSSRDYSKKRCFSTSR